MEGEKELFLVCFSLSFLDPTSYIVITKPETLPNPLCSDVMNKILSTHEASSLLLLGPTVLDITDTDTQSDYVGESATATVTVRDLIELHTAIKQGMEVHSTLVHALLRPADDVQQQGGKIDQRVDKRVPSPTKVCPVIKYVCDNVRYIYAQICDWDLNKILMMML